MADLNSSISQEEQDLRLAMALQQEENAAVYNASKKKHDDAIAAQKTRTARSSVGTSLSHIRKVQKDKGDSDYEGAGSGAYTAPGNDSDAALAAELQKAEQASLGTAAMVEKLVKSEATLDEASKTRTGYSVYRK